MITPRIFLMIALVAAWLPRAGADDTTETGVADPFLWLEEVDGERALEWVHEQNRRTESHFADHPRFERLKAQALSVLDADTRIPGVTQRGEYLYNFWQDADHPRGIYRRTTLEEFRQPDPEWETVVDIDAMSERDDIAWSWSGMNCLSPENVKCLVYLSPGGGDSITLREFDASTLEFVDDGFELPKSKMRVGWRDEDSLFVATDFGEGSMTDSGYPRCVKIWKRGTPLSEAKEIYLGSQQSVAVGAYRIRMDEGDVDIVNEGLDFWNNQRFQLLDGELEKLELPVSASIVAGYKGDLVVQLTKPWEVGGESFPAGAVLIASPAMLRGDEDGAPRLLVKGDDTRVVEDVSVVGDVVLVTLLDNVRGRLEAHRRNEKGVWTRREIDFPDNGTIHVTSTDDDTGSFFVSYENFVTPTTLYFLENADAEPVAIKSQGASFDGERFKVEQNFATSKDGTRVPYFVVSPIDMATDGSNPTHIFSYGGFRVSLTPSYSGSYEALAGAYGKLWLERGGVFVLAAIRGGGEYGPNWHAAALRENRPRAYEDFEAVAEDLIRRRITSPEHLGIEGRSNGGLLVGATMTRRPDLYGAVVSGVPLLDMKRYHTLLAGASWMAEYGDPDVAEDWAFMKQYSPYQNIRDETRYPPIFFYTSTRDDRVHPGHARKMAAALLAADQEVWYYENTEGGHGGSSTNDQLAHRLALSYSHLWEQLGGQ